MNLDALRRKRSNRLGVKATSYTGQRRVFFILDRATRKFHGDTGLWLQYLTFARKQKANKKVTRIITTMLRLHPTNPELWAYAADYAMDERGDVTEARSYMQRGLRFCSRSKHLWSEYLKLEMIYISKIVARRHILGLDLTSSENHRIHDIEAPDADVIPLAQVTVEDMASERQSIRNAGQKISEAQIASTPALTGAIPLAIFDSAMYKFPDDGAFGAQMFGVVAEFHQLQCTRRILQYIVDVLMTSAPASSATLSCFINEPVIGLDATSIALPGALITVLDRFDSTMRRLESLSKPLEIAQSRASVARRMVQWIMPYFRATELDPDVRAVLSSLVETAWDHCLPDIEAERGSLDAEMTALLEDLHAYGFGDLVQLG